MMADSSPNAGDGSIYPNSYESGGNSDQNPMNESRGDVLGDDDNEENDGPTSSMGNIIPMDKIKNGWFALSSYVTAQATIAREKAIELNNSEAVQNMKKRTSETIGPAWEKSVEVAMPYWEKTKDVTTPYVEKTKENAALLSENMKPRVEAGWKTVSEAAFTAAEYTSGLVSKAGFAAGSNMTV